MALVLATDDSPASLIGVFEGFVGMWNDLATIEGFFRAGGGMSWGDHHPALNDAKARFTRPMYRAALVDGWIAALDGVTGRLQAGGRSPTSAAARAPRRSRWPNGSRPRRSPGSTTATR